MAPDPDARLAVKAGPIAPVTVYSFYGGIITFLPALAGAAGSALIGWFALQREIAPTQAVFLGALSTLLGVSFSLFAYHLRHEGRLSVESHWGGLGGGLAGWRISPSLTYFVLTGALLVLMYASAGLDSGAGGLGYLGERYRGAINAAHEQKIQKLEVSTRGGKLHLMGAAPSAQALYAVWDKIKIANPAYDDVVVEITAPSTSAAQPAPASAPAGGTGAATGQTH